MTPVMLTDTGNDEMTSVPISSTSNIHVKRKITTLCHDYPVVRRTTDVMGVASPTFMWYLGNCLADRKIYRTSWQ